MLRSTRRTSTVAGPVPIAHKLLRSARAGNNLPPGQHPPGLNPLGQKPQPVGAPEGAGLDPHGGPPRP